MSYSNIGIETNLVEQPKSNKKKFIAGGLIAAIMVATIIVIAATGGSSTSASESSSVSADAVMEEGDTGYMDDIGRGVTFDTFWNENGDYGEIELFCTVGNEGCWDPLAIQIVEFYLLDENDVYAADQIYDDSTPVRTEVIKSGQLSKTVPYFKDFATCLSGIFNGAGNCGHDEERFVYHVRTSEDGYFHTIRYNDANEILHILPQGSIYSEASYDGVDLEGDATIELPREEYRDANSRKLLTVYQYYGALPQSDIWNFVELVVLNADGTLGDVHTTAHFATERNSDSTNIALGDWSVGTFVLNLQFPSDNFKNHYSHEQENPLIITIV